jgi:hypothetical protein
MTTGEWLASLSSAPSGSTALEVVADIEGTYPVLTPVESFSVDIIDEVYSTNLDIISISANVNEDVYTVDFSDDSFVVDLTQENINVNH